MCQRYVPFVGCLSLLFQMAAGQEMVKEAVAVNWWIVPFFAIDRGENPVQSLTNADVWLLVDGKTTTDFQISKQNIVGPAVAAAAESQPAPAVKKVVFLIFDVALSSHGTINNAKLIARDILQKAEPETQFGIAVIDALSGLVLISSPQADQKALLGLLETKVNPTPNSAPFSAAQTAVETENMVQTESARSGQTKYEGDELEFFIEQHSKKYIPKINNFFESFESFYYLVTGIQEKKFFYLFSEGLTNDGVELITKSLFIQKIKDTADFLNKSGGVVFIVNPTGTPRNASDPLSGEYSLRLIADESGGKYLQGESNRIVERIASFDRAYYEIAFPAPKIKGAAAMHVEIKSKRRGMDIYSPSLLALPKAMADMNPYEVEVLIQQCLRNTLPLNGGYTVFHESIVFQGAFGEGGKEAVSLKLPQPLRNRQLDAFWVGYDAAGRVVRMDKGTAKTGKDFVTLAVPVEKEGMAEIIDLKLVILDIKGNAAMICDDTVTLD